MRASTSSAATNKNPAPRLLPSSGASRADIGEDATSWTLRHVETTDTQNNTFDSERSTLFQYSSYTNDAILAGEVTGGLV